MGDQRTDSKRRMWVDVLSRPTSTLLILFGVILLPFILIKLAIIEYNFFGTTHLENLGRAIGIYGPLQALYRKAPWIWGY